MRFFLVLEKGNIGDMDSRASRKKSYEPLRRMWLFFVLFMVYVSLSQKDAGAGSVKKTIFFASPKIKDLIEIYQPENFFFRH